MNGPYTLEQARRSGRDAFAHMEWPPRPHPFSSARREYRFIAATQTIEIDPPWKMDEVGQLSIGDAPPDEEATLSQFSHVGCVVERTVLVPRKNWAHYPGCDCALCR